MHDAICSMKHTRTIPEIKCIEQLVFIWQLLIHSGYKTIGVARRDTYKTVAIFAQSVPELTFHEFIFRYQNSG